MSTIAAYIVFVLDAHLIQLFVQLLMASHRTSFVRTCTQEEVVNLVVDILLVQSGSFLDINGIA